MNKKPNIVIVLNSGEQLGGIERHVGDLVKGLSNDFNFTVICKNGPMVKEYQDSGATFVELYPRLDFDPFYQLKLFRLLKSLRPIALHSHDLKVGFNAMLAGVFSRVPTRIYHVHTPICQWQLPVWKKLTFGRLNLLVNWFTGNCLATEVIALTNVIKKERMELEGIKESKIVIIPNGVDAVSATVDKETLRKYVRKEWGIPQNSFVVGNLSRLTEEKGHEILVNAFSKLAKKDSFLVIAGDGHLKVSLESQARSLGITDHVKFLGAFNNQDKYRILASFDLFVFPTLAEGFGIVMIEAMLARVPVLASNLTVLKEVGGDTVAYFNCGDANDLSKRIYEFNRYDEKVERAYKRVVDNYSMEKFLDSYKKLYLKQIFSLG